MPDQIGKVKTTGTRKWDECKSSSPETAEPPAKLVRSTDNQVRASPSEAELETTVRQESSNTSLEDIKGILDNIQDTIARTLHENGQLRNELKELKASLKSRDREVQSLQKSLRRLRSVRMQSEERTLHFRMASTFCIVRHLQK